MTAEHGPLPDLDPDRCDPHLLMQLLQRFPHVAPRRVPALLAACRRHLIDPWRQAVADGDVDLWLCVTGDIPAARFLAVVSAGGDARAASLHGSLAEAKARACRELHETLWEEWPVVVVDLDTHAEWAPECVVTWSAVEG